MGDKPTATTDGAPSPGESTDPEQGDEVAVLSHDGERQYTGEYAGDNGDGTGVVIGPCHPADPSGFRRVEHARIELVDDEGGGGD